MCRLTPAQAQTDGDDPIAGLQADLDRFRDLAMRSQADFDNYKKRCAREKEEAIKYANKSLLEKLVSIVDHFELGLEAARGEGEKSPIYSGNEPGAETTPGFSGRKRFATDRSCRPKIRSESARSDRSRAER